MKEWLSDILQPRPLWMNALMFFCAFMALVYMPWDLFAKPLAEDVEVWFGIGLRGWAAKLTAPLHWAIYAAGAYGFWRMRPWLWPWAAVYAAQVTGGMFVWTFSEVAWPTGALLAPAVAIPFTIITVLLWNARDTFQAPPPSLRERYGEWALVTGASSGIGWEFARILAREGMSCVLTARRETELKRLAGELESRYKVGARIVAADLGEESGVEAVEAAVQGLDLGVVVNNAGVGYSGRFDKQDADRLVDMVELNCVAPVRLTSRLVPRLIERRRGALIFTGSVAGRLSLPLEGVYSATKAFDRHLGESLWAELRPFGVDVVVVEPGPVDTAFTRVAGQVRDDPGIAPNTVVETALAALGRQPSVVPGWGLRAGSWLGRLLPAGLVLHLSHDVTRRQTPREMR